MIFYMPTIALSNSVAYNVLKSNNFDVVKNFPPIRVWGTIGFIAAMWLTNLTGNKASENQFYIASVAAIGLGLYSFSLPKCKPQHTTEKNKSFVDLIGLSSFKLFANYKLALFFIFSMFLGAALLFFSSHFFWQRRRVFHSVANAAQKQLCYFCQGARDLFFCV